MSGPITGKTPGEVAYQAYMSVRDPRITGSDYKWSQLSDNAKEAWEAAAKAVAEFAKR